jgi:hypothetical protein
VTRLALQNAASIASLMLTTKPRIADVSVSWRPPSTRALLFLRPPLAVCAAAPAPDVPESFLPGDYFHRSPMR